MATDSESLVPDIKEIKQLLEANYTYNEYFQKLSDQSNKSVEPPEIPVLNKDELGEVLRTAVPANFGNGTELYYINNAAKAGFALIKLRKTAPFWAVGAVREAKSDSGY